MELDFFFKINMFKKQNKMNYKSNESNFLQRSDEN